jgi:hypothetical protein
MGRVWKVNKNRVRLRRPLCIGGWYARFEQLAESDPDASALVKALNLSLSSGGTSHTASFLYLLYTYVYGAPNSAQLSNGISRSEAVQVAQHMRELTDAIKRFEKGELGSAFRRVLETTAITSTSAKDELGLWLTRYNELPVVLSGLSQILGTISDNSIRICLPSDRKLVQTKALALLYFHLSSSLCEKSDYRTASDLAILLRPAYEAAGTRREDLTHQTVTQRIKRFLKHHPHEVSVLKKLAKTLPSQQDLRAWLFIRPYRSTMDSYGSSLLHFDVPLSTSDHEVSQDGLTQREV